MPTSRLRSEADQDRLLIRIYKQSRKFAIGAVREEDVDDVVHDVVLHCQAKLRSGAWTERPRNVQAFVRKLVRDTIADRRRREKCDDENAAEYSRIQRAFVPEWMAPDHDWREEDIVEFQMEVAKKLPYLCRLAYYMVRVEGESYTNAAKRLKLSRNTVHNFIVKAQRLYREELRQLGIADPSAFRKPQPDRPGKGPNHERFRPDYVAQQEIVAID